MGLFSLARMQRELAEITGRNVDLVTRKSVEDSENRRRRESILSSAQTIYAA